MTEEWRAIEGYEGYYEVSDRGRVRSLDRVVTDKRGRQRNLPGRIRTPGALPMGYLQVPHEFCRGARPSDEGYQAWLFGLKKNADHLSDRGAEYDRIMKRAMGVPTFPYRIPLRELLQEVIDIHADPDNPGYNDCDVDPCMWCVSAKSHLEEMAE